MNIDTKIKEISEVIASMEVLQESRGRFHHVSDFFFGPNEPDLYLAQAKYYLHQAKQLSMVGYFGESYELLKKSTSAFQEHHERYGSYLIESLNHESKITFGIKCAFTAGALILTGFLLAPYLPFAIGLTTTGGLGGALQAGIGLMAGGAAVYSSTSLIGRALTPGESIEDSIQFQKDLRTGAFVGLAMFFSPFAGAAGRGLAIGTEGIPRFALQNLSIAGTSGALSAVRVYSEEGDLKKAALAGGIGIASAYALPVMALGMEKVEQLPQTLRSLLNNLNKPNVQASALKPGEVISLQNYRIKLLAENGEENFSSPIDLFRARYRNPSGNNVIPFGVRPARVMQGGALDVPRQAVAYASQAPYLGGGAAPQLQLITNQELAPEAIPTPIPVSSEFLTLNSAPFLFDLRDFLNMPQVFFWAPFWDSKEQRYLSFVEQENQKLFRKLGEIKSDWRSPNEIKMSTGEPSKDIETTESSSSTKDEKLEAKSRQPILLQSAQEYNNSPTAKPDLELLERMLKEIYKVQFKAENRSMVTEDIAKTTYRSPGDNSKLIKGYILLYRYSQARWLRDHPQTKDIAQEKAVKEKGYKLSDSIGYFLREVLGQVATVKTDFVLQSAQDYDSSKGAKIEIELLERMLKEIYEIQFKAKNRSMTAGSILDTSYQSPRADAKSIDGISLLYRYSQARWLRDHPGEKNIRQMAILKQEGYSPSSSVDYFLREILHQTPQVEADFVLQSIQDYDPSKAAPCDLEPLERMLKEIYDVQFKSKNRSMVAQSILETTYQSSGDNPKLLTGLALLRRYSHARWLRDHPQEKEIGQREAGKQKGYGPVDSIHYFLKEVLGQPQQTKADFVLQSAQEYDSSPKAKLALESLERILREIYEIQFKPKGQLMIAENIVQTTYQSSGSDEKSISGKSLLYRYSHARWLRDHPKENDIGQKKVIAQKGYRPIDSTEYFLKEVLDQAQQVKADFVLQSAQGYDSSRGVSLEIEFLEKILKEIHDIQFKPKGQSMTVRHLLEATYQSSQGDSGLITGSALLYRYSQARWFRDHPEEKSIRQTEIVKQKGYSLLDSIDYFSKNVLGVLDFNTISEDELNSFIQSANLQEILNLFSQDPALLISALAFLKPEEFKHKDVAEFVKSYVGLGVGRKSAGEGVRAEIDPWGKRRLYLLALARALEAGEKLDLSEVNFKNQLELLKRLSYKSFEEGPLRLISELEAQAAITTHPFIQRLHQEAADHFRRDNQFEERGMKTVPFGYQKAGARFFVAHDYAINGDEAGMGKSRQAISAVEYLGLKKILWITTASNKENVRDEILTHSYTPPQAIQVVISGDVQKRTEQIAALNDARYLITNYETLRDLQRFDPTGYAKLTAGIEAQIIDEAQLTDNPEALRSKAVRDIQAPRRWLLTATPYQNRPENIWALLNWLDPQRYPDFAAFKKIYTESTQGLALLHSELSEIMLRRTKRDALSYFVSPVEIPFEEQLAHGIPRIPRLVRLSPEQAGRYTLSLPQADLIARMTADFEGWTTRFNAALPAGAKPIALANINPLLKFDMIHKAIYFPEKFGITEPNPMLATLDGMVAERVQMGKKIILWCWNTEMIDVLAERYKSLGVRRIDSQIVGTARDNARRDFQEDPQVKVLVANYLSGGVGLTFTAADSAIFVQLPQAFPPLYQASRRIQRLVGSENIRFAKEQVEEAWLVPIFPPRFVDEIQEERLREILLHGTLVEQSRDRLEGGELLYHLLMDGFGKLEDLDNYFKTGLLRALGLSLAEKQKLMQR